MISEFLLLSLCWLISTNCFILLLDKVFIFWYLGVFMKWAWMILWVLIVYFLIFGSFYQVCHVYNLIFGSSYVLGINLHVIFDLIFCLGMSLPVLSPSIFTFTAAPSNLSRFNLYTCILVWLYDIGLILFGTLSNHP